MTNNTPKSKLTTLYACGYAIVIAATILHIFEFSYAPYCFIAGAALAIIGRGMTLPKGDHNTRRLNMILGLGALFLLAAAYFMFKGSNSWAVMLIITAIIDLYTSFRQK